MSVSFPPTSNSLLVAPVLRPIVLFDLKSLLTDCLVTALQTTDESILFENVADIEAALSSMSDLSSILVVLCHEQAGGDTTGLMERLAALKGKFPLVKVAVLMSSINAEVVRKVIAGGASGYVPTDVSLKVFSHIVRLIMVGGVFIPSSCLTSEPLLHTSPSLANGVLNSREVAVAKALRKGTPNKLIAYELNLCESTVKLLVRGVMRKLNARNRTEVAYLTTNMFIGGADRAGST